MNNRAFPKLECILIAILVLVLFLNGCGKSSVKVYAPITYSDDNGYFTFTAENGIPRFSFEYPSDYNLLSYQSMPEVPITSVLLSDVDYRYQEEYMGDYVIRSNIVEYPPEAEWDYKLVNIFIDKYSPEAATALKECIAEHKRYAIAGLSEDFRLLQKRRVVVAGIEGWEIVLSYIDLPVMPHGSSEVRTRAVPVVARELFFDYQDMAWNIRVYSDEGNAEQARLDYEHILQTLRILN